MPKLTIRTHDGTVFELDIDENPIEVPGLHKDEWLQFESTDGKRLTLHPRSIHSILREEGT